MIRHGGCLDRGRVAAICACLAAFALVAGAGGARPAFAQPDEIDIESAAPPDPPPTADPPRDGGPDGGAPVVDEAAAKAAARKLLDGGDAFLKKGDALLKRKKTADAQAQYGRALAAYQKAFELVPNPQILFPIAIAEQKLAMWPQAARDLHRFLVQVPDGDPKLRADAQKRFEAVKMNLGVLALVVAPADAEVEVTLEGVVFGRTPELEPLFLPPGEYTLGFTADGYQPLEQKIVIELGSESERSFELAPIPVIVEPPRPAIPTEPEIVLPPKPRKLPLILTAGLAVGFAAGATTAGLLAVGKHSTFADEGVAFAKREDARTSGKRLALLTDGLIVGAVVATGIATYYYLKVYRPKARARADSERRQRAQFNEFAAVPKVLVAPWVERSAGGLVLTGAL